MLELRRFPDVSTWTCGLAELTRKGPMPLDLVDPRDFRVILTHKVTGDDALLTTTRAIAAQLENWFLAALSPNTTPRRPWHWPPHPATLTRHHAARSSGDSIPV